LTVAELDREDADRRDYWVEIVDVFNDYVQYKYQNIMYQNNKYHKLKDLIKFILTYALLFTFVRTGLVNP